ncbi:DUF1353 domain-containing protein [Pontiellaceae bacterium B12219]|nr:DUF1353 domain-containing protein [Pontiellaceae bacterium B12219]
MENIQQIITTGSRIGFNDSLQVELLPGGRCVRLTNNFKVTLAVGRMITVPAGFETDFASVPRLFWRIIPPWGRYSAAAVVHDYLYATASVTRYEADRIFLDLMKRLGVPLWKRRLMYRAVRLGGWASWKRFRSQNR